MLLGIAPGPEGLELRTFECGNCEQLHKRGRQGPDEYGLGRLDRRQTEGADLNAVTGALYDRIMLKAADYTGRPFVYRVSFWAVSHGAFAGVKRTSFGTR